MIGDLGLGIGYWGLGIRRIFIYIPLVSPRQSPQVGEPFRQSLMGETPYVPVAASPRRWFLSPSPCPPLCP
jgi:hypothetical protein